MTLQKSSNLWRHITNLCGFWQNSEFVDDFRLSQVIFTQYEKLIVFSRPLSRKRYFIVVFSLFFFGLKNCLDHFNRYKKWIVGDKKCESNNVQRFICMIGVKTLPELISSAYGRQLFINKFPWDFQPRAWDCILAWHFHKVQEEKITGRPALDHYSFLDNIQIKYSRKETENIWISFNSHVIYLIEC